MPDLVSPIRGKVARILSSRELALNVGSLHGVEVGMRFDVLDPKGEQIIDPVTNEDIGSVLRPKVRVQITLVQDKLSVASTFRTKKKNVGGTGLAGLAFGEMFKVAQWVDQVETLRTSETTWEDLDEEHSFVKRGDPVLQVLEPEREGEQTPRAASLK